MTDSVIRRTRGRRSDVTNKRSAVYVDQDDNFRKRSGVCVDPGQGASDKRSAILVEEDMDETTPLLREDLVVKQIIDQTSTLNKYERDLLSQGESLQAATASLQKMPQKKPVLWKRMCCCCFHDDGS